MDLGGKNKIENLKKEGKKARARLGLVRPNKSREIARRRWRQGPK